MHYNIGKKQEINPFEKVNFVTIESNISIGVKELEKYLNNKAIRAETKKVNGKFIILFDIELLNFVSLLSWFEPYRGKFQVKSHSIHFRIEGEIMHCW